MQKRPPDVSSLVLFLSSPCVTNVYFSSQYQYIIVKWTGIKWEQGQISTTCVEYCLIQHQIIKPNKIRNVWQTGQFIWKSVEWKGQLISTQSLPYIINAHWQNLRTTVRSGCPSLPCISTEWVEQINTVERKSWKFSLRKTSSVNDMYIALPGSQHSVSFCEKENQKNPITVKTSI